MTQWSEVILLVRHSQDFDQPIRIASAMASAWGIRVHVLVDQRLGLSDPQIEEWLKSLNIPLFSVRTERCTDVIETCLGMSKAPMPQPIVVSSYEASLFQKEHSIATAGEREGSAHPDPDLVRLIESFENPILLLRRGIESQWPWPSLAVPMSGESRCSQALTVAIEFAQKLSVPIDLIRSLAPSSEAIHGDEVHHELEPMLEEFITHACPFASPTDRRRIRQMEVVASESAEAFLRHPLVREAGALVVEWKGVFTAGHAEILKKILAELSVAVLLVRESAVEVSSLRAGRQLG